jgi:bisphosphoglycerate-independent phosphoglycerate mutase (AlkP superfamily)
LRITWHIDYIFRVWDNDAIIFFNFTRKKTGEITRHLVSVNHWSAPSISATEKRKRKEHVKRVALQAT